MPRSSWDQLGGAARAPASGFELFQRSLAGRPLHSAARRGAAAAPRGRGRVPATRLGARGEAATRSAAEIRMPCQRRQTGTACAAPQFVGRLYWQVGLPGNFLYSKQSELVNLTTPLTLCLNLN